MSTLDSPDLSFAALISLIELYEDQRLDGVESINEPEFRAYQILSHLHDQEVARSILALPANIFNHPWVQLAFDFRAFAQRNFDTQKVGSKSNAEISLNFFSRFFKLVKQDEVPFLMACLAHNKFGEIRRAGIRALRSAYARVQQSTLGTSMMKSKIMYIDIFTKLMGCVSEEEAFQLATTMNLDAVWESGDTEGPGLPLGFLVSAGADFNGEFQVFILLVIGDVWTHRVQILSDNADAPAAEKWPEIDSKRKEASFQTLINGHGLVPPSNLRPSALAFVPRNVTPAKIQPPPVKPKVETVATEAAAALNRKSPAPSTPTLSAGNRSSSFTFNVGQASPSPLPNAPFTFASTTPPTTNPLPAPETKTSTPSKSVSSKAASPFTGLEQLPATPNLSGSAQPFMPGTSTLNRSPAQTRRSIVKRPSELQMDLIGKRVASQLLFSVIRPMTETILSEAVETEVRRRQAEAREQKQRQLEHKVAFTANHIFDSMVQQIQQRISAEAFVNERRRRAALEKTWLHWRVLAQRYRRRRETREARRKAFEADVGGLQLDASMGSRLQNSASRVSRVVPDERLISEDLSLSFTNEDSTAARLDKLSRQKAIFEEGTYFSLVGNHVCNIESDLDMLEEQTSQVTPFGQWSVVVDTTDRPSGRWLKSKFGLGDADHHSGHFAGSCREGDIVAMTGELDVRVVVQSFLLIVLTLIIYPHDIQHFSSDVGLIVLECGDDFARRVLIHADVLAT